MKLENNIKKDKVEDLYDELLQLSIDLTTKAIPSKIYHYTSMEALFNGILCNCNNESKICLRASNVLYMNDPNEIQFGLSYFEKLFDNDIKNDFNTYAEKCSNYFLTSFSSQKDYLPMWNIYAHNATGIALGFNSNVIKGNKNGEFLSCLYGYEKLRSILEKYFSNEKELKENTSDNNNKELVIGIIIIILFFILLQYSKDKSFIDDVNAKLLPILRLIVSLKDPSYSYEQEVRLLSVSEKDEDLRFYFKNNYFIPYINHYFPKEALEEIIVGPNNDMERTIYSIKTYLKHIGFEHVKVIPSNVPYRG